MEGQKSERNSGRHDTKARFVTQSACIIWPTRNKGQKVVYMLSVCS